MTKTSCAMGCSGTVPRPPPGDTPMRTPGCRSRRPMARAAVGQPGTRDAGSTLPLPPSPCAWPARSRSSAGRGAAALGPAAALWCGTATAAAPPAGAGTAPGPAELPPAGAVPARVELGTCLVGAMAAPTTRPALAWPHAPQGTVHPVPACMAPRTHLAPRTHPALHTHVAPHEPAQTPRTHTASHAPTQRPHGTSCTHPATALASCRCQIQSTVRCHHHFPEPPSPCAYDSSAHPALPHARDCPRTSQAPSLPGG